MLASLAAVFALLAALLVPLLASLAAVVAGSCIRFDHALRFARCVPLLASFAAVLTNANHTLASLCVEPLPLAVDRFAHALTGEP